MITQIDSCVAEFYRRIALRRNGRFDLSWCLKDFNDEYWPDYFQINRFGFNTSERWLNYGLGMCWTQLWKKTVWHVLVNKMFFQIQNRMVDHFHRHHHHEDKERFLRDFTQTITRRLMAPRHEIRDATFTDMFLLMSDSLTALFKSVGVQDAFAQEKRNQNAAISAIYNLLKPLVMADERGLELALYFAIRGNWIDSVEADTSQYLAALREEVNVCLDEGWDYVKEIKQGYDFYQIDLLLKRFRGRPQTVLYELDNSGEVILDLLVIEWCLKLGHRVYLTAKTRPIINDVTYTELVQLFKQPEFSIFMPYLQQDRLVLIDTHSTIAGKYLLNVSPAYQQAYQAADFLILKGQGNFQTMPMGQIRLRRHVPYRYRKPIFYLMGIKASLIHRTLCYLFVNHPHIMPQMPFLYLYE